MALNSRSRLSEREMALVAAAVYVIRARGADSLCGCPGACDKSRCMASAVKCEFNPIHLPRELNGVMTMEEYSSMIREVYFG